MRCRLSGSERSTHRRRQPWSGGHFKMTRFSSIAAPIRTNALATYRGSSCGASGKVSLFGELLGTEGDLRRGCQLDRAGRRRLHRRTARPHRLQPQPRNCWSRSLGPGHRCAEPRVPADRRRAPPHGDRSTLVSRRTIGVDPSRQGQGIGSRLLEAANARANADVYSQIVLLTLQPRNVPLYERHGYKTVCGGTEPSSGLAWWGVRREATGRKTEDGERE